jgi:hypothetical protein
MSRCLDRQWRRRDRGDRPARSCVSRGEGGREAGQWAVQQGGAQLAVGRGYDMWS